MSHTHCQLLTLLDTSLGDSFCKVRAASLALVPMQEIHSSKEDFPALHSSGPLN